MGQHIVRRFLVANWWSFHNQYFVFDKPLIYICGKNGSGKSSIQDAISLILYAEDTNKLNYTSEDRRTAVTAIHWGAGEEARRPGKTYSYIIMENRDANDRIYHQGIRYMSKAGSNEINDRVFFWGEGDLESIGALDPVITDRGEVVMKSKTSNRENAFTHFFERRGYLESFYRDRMNDRAAYMRFRDMNRSIMSNKGIKDGTVASYVKASIFPPTSTADNCDMIGSAIRRLDELRLEDEENRKKERFLQNVYDRGMKYLNAKSAEAFETLMAPYLNVLFYTEEIRKCKEETLLAEALEKESMEQRKTLSRERDVLVEEQGRVRGEEDPLSKARARLNTARLLLQSRTAGFEKYEAYHSAEKDLLSMQEISVPEDGDIHAAAEAYLEKAGKQQDALLRQTYEIERKVRENAGTIRSLRGSVGDSSAAGAVSQMKEDAELLKAMIWEEIPGAEPMALYECVERIRDESWQEAIEGLIGNNRFGVIVAPEYYDAACVVQHRLKNNKRDCILLNTKRSRPPMRGSVPELFEFNNEDARRFVETQYGAYILCLTDDQYVNASYALRKNGQNKAPGRSIKPGISKKVVKVLGAAAIERTISELEAANRALTEEITSLREKKGAVSRKIRFCSEKKGRLEEHRAFSGDSVRDDYLAAEEEVRQAEAAVEEAKSSDAVLKKKERLDRLQQEIDGLGRSIDEAYSKGNQAKTRREEIEKARKTCEEQLALFEKMRLEQGSPVPSEEDMERVRNIPGYESSIRSTVRTNSRLDVLRKETKNARELLATYLSDNVELKDRFVDFPETIESAQELGRIGEELDAVTGIVFSEEHRESLSRLQSSLESSYCLCLQNVYQEYRGALDIRDSTNRIISRYRIGDYYYRLGPINSTSGPDVNILELARLQCEEGLQLDMRQTEAMNSLCRRAFEAGWNPFDYTRYITTEIQYRASTDSTWKNADSVLKNNSNGQQGILRYLFKIIVLYSQVFNGEKSLNFITTDEALGGVDDVNSGYFFDILGQLGVQSLISTFEDRFAEYSDLIYIFEQKDANIDVHLHEIDEEKESDGQK